MAPRSPLADPILQGGRDNDIVIPVMGPTKAGKSSFLNQLVGPKTFRVGEKLASCTEVIASHAVQEVPRGYPQHAQLEQLLDGRRIILVDTPGFDDTHMGDEEILNRISEWLTKSYRKHMYVGGVLYLHDMSRDGFPGSLFRNLTLFTKICGPDAMDQVAFVTTKWDRLQSRKEGDDRVTELSEEFWKKNIDAGAKIFHVQPATNDSRRLSRHHKKPWEIIHQMVLTADTRDVEDRILQIQAEIVHDKRFLPETDAGKELRMSLADLLKTAKDLKRRAREDAGAGKPTDSLEMRQREIDKITAQLKALRPPGLFTRVKRFFGISVSEFEVTPQ